MIATRPVILKRWGSTWLPGRTGLHLHLGGIPFGHPNFVDGDPEGITTGPIESYDAATDTLHGRKRSYQLVGPAHPTFLRELRAFAKEAAYRAPEVSAPAGRVTSKSAKARIVAAVQKLAAERAATAGGAT